MIHLTFKNKYAGYVVSNLITCQLVQGNSFISGAGGLSFKSLTGQIGHGVASG